jgi:DNA-binding transcriptional ArsR family regulator
MEDAGLLHTRAAGRRRLAYPGPAAESPPALDRARAMLAGPTTRRVAEGVLARPGIGIEELLETLGESPRAVYYHVKRLVDAGLVLRDPRVRYASLSPGPLLQALLVAPRIVEHNGETCA